MVNLDTGTFRSYLAVLLFCQLLVHHTEVGLAVKNPVQLPKTLFTRYNRLSNRLSNRLNNWVNNRLHNIQPVVQPVVQPV